MPLYVKDEDVNALAERAQKLLKTASKTEAVKIALERVVDQEEERLSLRERLLRLQEEVRLKYGTPDPDFDDKKYFDEMWGM